MNRSRFLLVVILIWLSLIDVGAASAGRIELLVECPGADESAVALVSLSPASPDLGEPVSLEWPVGLQSTVPGELSGTWRVEVDASGCWAPPVMWTAGNGRINVKMVPAGRLLFGAGEPSPEWAKVLFLYSAPSQKSIEIEQACRNEKNIFDCSVPAGTLDLRVELPGFAPIFFWDLEVPVAEPLNVGHLKLQPGASVSGWVEIAAGSELGTVEIEVRPLAAAGAESQVEIDRRSLRLRKTRANERGHFVMAGLKPGIYGISAHRPGFSSREIEVEMRLDHLALEETLVLIPKSELTIVLEPALDPWGQPWHVRLDRETGETRVFETVALGAAADKGAWTSQALGAGDYRALVIDSRGGKWRAQMVALSGGPETVFWEVDVVPIRGVVRFGDEPLPAELLFGKGTDAIAFSADENGVFEGSLPEEGLWPVRLQTESSRQAVDPVEIRIREGKSYATAEINLPATLLKGEVTKDGQSAKALIVARRISPSEFDSRERASELAVWSDEEGLFEVTGLAEGQLEIRASDSAAESDWVMVRLIEDHDAEVQLELTDRVTVRGRVGRGTRAVAGAKVIALSEGTIVGSSVADASGAFQLRLNSKIRFVELIVVANDDSISLYSTPVLPEENPEIALDLPAGRGRVAIEVADTPPEKAHSAADFIPDGVLIGNGASISFRQLLTMFPPAEMVYDGAIRLPPLGAGSWQICASASMVCQRVEVLDGTELKLDLSG